MIGQKLAAGVGMLIRLQDSIHHMADSSDLAFTLAAIGAQKEGKYPCSFETCGKVHSYGPTPLNKRF